MMTLVTAVTVAAMAMALMTTASGKTMKHRAMGCDIICMSLMVEAFPGKI